MSTNAGPSRRRESGSDRRRLSRDANLDKNLQNLASKAESRLEAKRKARAEARKIMRVRHEEMEAKAAKKRDSQFIEESTYGQKMDVLKLKLADAALTPNAEVTTEADLMNEGIVLNLKQQLADAISTKNELELSKTMLYFTIEDLRDRLEAAEADVYTAVANTRQIKKTLQTVQNERDNKTSDYLRCLQEREEAERTIKDLENQIESSRESNHNNSEDLKYDMKKLRDKLRKSEDHVTEIKAKITDMTNEKRVLTDQLDESTRRAEVEIAEALANSRRKTAVSGDTARLKSENEDLKVDLARVERQLAKQMDNNKRDKANMEELEEANSNLRKEMRKHNRELRAMRGRMADLEMELERTKSV